MLKRSDANLEGTRVVRHTTTVEAHVDEDQGEKWKSNGPELQPLLESYLNPGYVDLAWIDVAGVDAQG